MTGTLDKNYDARKYTICAPWYGERNTLFRLWQQAFLAGIADEGDDAHDNEELSQTLIGWDVGGAQTIAAELAAGNPAPVLGLAATRRRRQRLKKGYKLLYKHIENEAIRQRFVSEAPGDGEACWTILVGECLEPEDEMVSTERKTTLQSSTILGTCGYSESSVTDYSRYLIYGNAQIHPNPARLSEHDLCVKMLTAIAAAAPHLKVEAEKELKAAPGARAHVHPPGHARAGQRSLARIVAHFDPLWKSQVESGLIARKAATQTGTGGISTRVDGLSAEAERLEELNSQWSEAFAMQSIKAMNERICWNCLGAGHVKDDCPSEVRDRPIAGMITLLTAIQNRNKGKSFGPVASTSNTSAPQRRPARRLPPRGRRVQGMLLENGTFVQDTDDAEPTPDDNVDTTEAATNAVDVEGCTDPDEFDVYETEVVYEEENTECYSMDNVMDDVPCKDSDDDPPVLAPAPRGTLFRRAILPAIAMGAAALALPARPARVVLPMLVLLASVHGARGSIVDESAPLTNVMQAVARFHKPPPLIVNAHMLETNCFSSHTTAPVTWTVDCGSDMHVHPNREVLSKVIAEQPNIKVRAANKKLMDVSCMGTIHTEVTTYKEVKDVNGSSKKYRPPKRVPSISKALLTSVLIVPGVAKPLFSCEHGFEHDGIQSHLNGERRLQFPDGAYADFNAPPKYTVDLGMGTVGAYAASTEPPRKCDPDTAHAILGHSGVLRIQSAAGRSTGLDLQGFTHDPASCIHCRRAGARRKPFKLPDKSPAKAFGDRVSSDLCGPFPASTPHGFKYICTFTDHATGEISVYFLKTKQADAVLAAFKQFIADNKHALPGGAVKEWHCDNGREFMSKDLDEFCAEFAVKRSYSIPWLPQSNGTAERTNGLLLRPARIMIAAEAANETLWPWAIAQAALIHNSLPTKRFDPPKSPIEAKTGKLPDLGKLHVLFRKCIVRLEDPDVPNKISPTGMEAQYLGRDVRRNADFVYIPGLKRITSAHHVDHLNDTESIAVPDVSEAKIYYREQKDLPTPAFGQPMPGLRAHYRDHVPTVPSQPDRTTPADPAAPHAVGTIPPAPQVPRVRLRFQGQDAALPAIANASFLHVCYALEAAVHYDPSSVGTIPLPRSWPEIKASPYAKEWIEGCKKDLTKKQANGAWEVVSKSELCGRKPLKGKWACVVKYLPDGTVDEFRSRWVGCGYSQIAGVDFDQISASVLRTASARLLCAVGAVEDCEICHIDISAAFTHSNIDKEIFVEMPHGFEEEGKVCKLRKGLEGLKQSGRLWSEHNAAILSKLGFEQSSHEPNIWTKKYGSKIARLGIYVDDALCVWPKGMTKEYTEFAAAYSKALNGHAKDLGEVKKFVGMEISRDRKLGTLTITQTKYIEKMQSKYLSGSNSKHWSGPNGSTDAEIQRWNAMSAAANDTENVRLQGVDYLGIIGSLLYASNTTRPDVQYHTSKLAQFMHAPKAEHYEAAQAVLGYLVKTKHMGVTYGGAIKPPDLPARVGTATIDEKAWASNHGMHLLSDASWGVPNPVGGHVIMFANGAVSWMSRKLKVVCDSSTEAELAAGAVGVKDLTFARNLLSDLGVTIHGTVPHALDNSGAYDAARNPGVSGRTKHFERWIHYVRDAFRRLKTTIHLTPDENMPADMLTKALLRGKHAYCRAYVLNL